ncbi:MAG: HAD-IA family hydrolase [Salinibacterium sp.]|nr:HAD-IA family hydrolase [Salinibacterium sp.]
MSLLFIFDMDDVLYDYNWRTRMARMTAITGHDLDELRSRWWHDEGEWAAEAGRYGSPENYLEQFNLAMGMRVEESDWVNARAEAMHVWSESLAAVRRASELGTITLLTNNGPLASKHLPTIAPELVELFGDHLHTSSDYQARKPEPAVFERVLEKYNTAAENAFFADDRPENIAGAESIGVTSYHFGTSAGMLAAIETFASARG